MKSWGESSLVEVVDDGEFGAVQRDFAGETPGGVGAQLGGDGAVDVGTWVSYMYQDSVAMWRVLENLWYQVMSYCWTLLKA